MMYRIVVPIFLIIAVTHNLMGQATHPSPSAKKSTQGKKKLTWKKYHAICGAKNESREKNFEKIKGMSILWVGNIAEITKDIALGDNPRWLENVIRVKMDPSDSLVADCRLRIPKALKDKMMAVEKGQYIAFKGKINYLGTKLSDHVVEVENFKRVKPKKNPAPGAGPPEAQ